MERAHVLVRLRGGVQDAPVGISRTSATSVRLEHSEMSPGVASISFERVFGEQDDNFHVFTSLQPAVDAVVDGRNATIVVTGAAGSGKSFTCRGDAETGVIVLAVRRVFSELERKNWQFNVLLSCWAVENGKTTDLVENANYDGEMEQLMLEKSVITRTAEDAEQLYLEVVNRAQDRDFAVAIHVETLSPSGEARRGRLLVVDIHGGGIIEPRGGSAEGNQQSQQKLLLDTQFPVNEPLSACFGSFVGNTCATYIIVAMQMPAQYQQQAIQSLLYACKAKDIKNTSAVNLIPSFIEKVGANPSRRHQSLELNGNVSIQQDALVTPKVDECAELSDLSTIPFTGASPAMSSTSSDSTCDAPFITPHEEELPEIAPRLFLNTSCESDSQSKQAAVSVRLRKAYEIAKAANSSPRAVSVRADNQEDEASLHVVADALLRHLSWDVLRGMTLKNKLEQIRTAQFELERELAHETSIKDKCVDRISRLSQTMSCQVVEHEQRLQEALTAKHKAEAQLQETTSKFEDVGREVSRLQKQIKAIRGEHKNDDAEGSAASESARGDRVMLHTLSSRLEEAMSEAQEVVKFKDSAIRSLEERLQLASKRGAEAATMLEQEKSRFEREKAELAEQLQQFQKDSMSKSNEEVAKALADNTLLQQQKAELTVKVAQLTLELETGRSLWAQDLRDREDQAERRCVNQVAEAEQRHEQAAIAMQQQMGQFRTELDTKLARQRVAAQVACKASEWKCEQLERELQHVKLKLAKQKLKLEKKARALVAHAHKQHAKPVAALERELEDLAVRLDVALEREQNAVARAKASREDVERLQSRVGELEAANAELGRERAALGHLCKDLETDKDRLKAELERQVHALEQSMAEQIQAAESKARGEYERQVQQLTEAHQNELSRLKAAMKQERRLADHRVPRQQSSSSVSSRASASDDGLLSSDSRQQNIDELDGLTERRKRAKSRRKDDSSRPPSSSPPKRSSSSTLKRTLARKDEQIAELTARQAHLLAALATANEQETLAKKHTTEAEARRRDELARYDQLLEQLNSVKKENWNLSLALHVTENTTQRCQPSPSKTPYFY